MSVCMVTMLTACQKNSSPTTPGTTPTPAGNQNCIFTDNTCVCKAPLSFNLNGTERIDTGAVSFSEMDGPTKTQIIYGSWLADDKLCQLDIYLKNYKGAGTYRIKRNETFVSYREEELGTFTSGMACEESGDVIVTEDANNRIKGKFSVYIETFDGKPLKFTGGYFYIEKNPE